MINLPETLEDVPFECVQGMTFATYAERVYQNKEYGIQINLVTKKKSNGQYTKGEKSYSLIGSKDFFDHYEGLVAHLKKGEAR